MPFVHTIKKSNKYNKTVKSVQTVPTPSIVTEEYEVVECEIHPANIVCPDCGGITLEGLDFCNKCGGEINFFENE